VPSNGGGESQRPPSSLRSTRDGIYFSPSYGSDRKPGDRAGSGGLIRSASLSEESKRRNDRLGESRDTSARCVHTSARPPPLSLSLSLSLPLYPTVGKKTYANRAVAFSHRNGPIRPGNMRYASDIGFIPVLIFLAGFAWRARSRPPEIPALFPRLSFPFLPLPPSLPPSLSLSLSLARGMESRSAISTRNGKTPAYKTISLFGELRSICADQQIISPSRYALAMYALLTVALERFRNGF